MARWRRASLAQLVQQAGSDERMQTDDVLHDVAAGDETESQMGVEESSIDDSREEASEEEAMEKVAPETLLRSGEGARGPLRRVAARVRSAVSRASVRPY